MIYTSYQTNSFKIIKSTFSIYELPHAPVIFPINLGIFNCFENSDRGKNFRQIVPIYGWWWGGGGSVAPLPHLNFRHCPMTRTEVMRKWGILNIFYILVIFCIAVVALTYTTSSWLMNTILINDVQLTLFTVVNNIEQYY